MESQQQKNLRPSTYVGQPRNVIFQTVCLLFSKKRTFCNFYLNVFTPVCCVKRMQAMCVPCRTLQNRTFCRYSASRLRSKSSPTVYCYIMVPTSAIRGTSWTASSWLQGKSYFRPRIVSPLSLNVDFRLPR